MIILILSACVVVLFGYSLIKPPRCSKCGLRGVKYDHDEPVNGVLISVYKCDKCGKEFV